MSNSVFDFKLLLPFFPIFYFACNDKLNSKSRLDVFLHISEKADIGKNFRNVHL